MMYSEFVKGTNCKQTEYNYNVFLTLEKIYIDSDLTKEEIYAIGKMRVDNSETPAEREAREKIEAEIAGLEKQILELKELILFNTKAKACELKGTEAYKYYARQIKILKEHLSDTRLALRRVKAFMR